MNSSSWLHSVAVGVILAGVHPHVSAAPVPMFELWHVGSTDYFYTTQSSHRDIAVSIGFVLHGPAFQLEDTNVAGTRAFHRYYKGAPQTDHFYTTSDVDRQYVEANGWVYEGVEGYLWSSAGAGRVALYRLNRASNGGGLEHYYSTDSEMVSFLQTQGWAFDGLAGYVKGVQPYCSRFMYQEHSPVVLIDTAYRAVVDMRNDCPGVWAPGKVWLQRKLGSWVPETVGLSTPVRFGQTVRFSFNVRAPWCASFFGLGYCNEQMFYWRLVRSGTGEFGEATSGTPMEVSFKDEGNASYIETINVSSSPPSPLPIGRPVPASAPLPPLAPIY